MLKLEREWKWHTAIHTEASADGPPVGKAQEKSAKIVNCNTAVAQCSGHG
jgi:hypothetical protein